MVEMAQPMVTNVPPQMQMPHPLQQQLEKIKNEPLLQPICTIYVQNINEKVKIVDLKNSLFQLFSSYGEVHEVHAKRNIRQRGQAYVVMNDPSNAEKAIKTLRGYPFFGKPLRLNFAKKEADYVTKLNGTFDDAILKKRNLRQEVDVKARELKQKRKMIDRLIKLRRQTAQMLGLELDQRFGTYNQQSGGIYKILFIERLPKRLKSESLSEIFASFHGFIEVRHIADKGYAFIEFVSDDFAAQALQQVEENNMLVFPSDEDPSERVTAKISFGKK